MMQIADSRRTEGIQASGLSAVMAVSGTIAFVLMALHLAWAAVVLIRNREQEKRTFHRFSIAVWVLWLIPYIIGAASAMS